MSPHRSACADLCAHVRTSVFLADLHLCLWRRIQWAFVAKLLAAVVLAVDGHIVAHAVVASLRNRQLVGRKERRC